MRMSYGELAGKPKTLQSLTGLNPKEFDKLLKSFKLVWEGILESSLERPERQRAYGAGRKAQLELIEDKYSQFTILNSPFPQAFQILNPHFNHLLRRIQKRSIKPIASHWVSRP